MKEERGEPQNLRGVEGRRKSSTKTTHFLVFAQIPKFGIHLCNDNNYLVFQRVAADGFSRACQEIEEGSAVITRIQRDYMVGHRASSLPGWDCEIQWSGYIRPGSL